MTARTTIADPVEVEKARAQLRHIASQAEDAVSFSGLSAAIARLAGVVESLLPPVEPEREPVPFVDYLPEVGEPGGGA